ncbi:hypothetical protein C8J56DRAFT_886483 [Mycena floridula]|nr:hypothetical protein C8J56DRAFT_886483 [Mycena floridula]
MLNTSGYQTVTIQTGALTALFALSDGLVFIALQVKCARYVEELPEPIAPPHSEIESVQLAEASGDVATPCKQRKTSRASEIKAAECLNSRAKSKFNSLPNREIQFQAVGPVEGHSIMTGCWILSCLIFMI